MSTKLVRLGLISAVSACVCVGGAWAQNTQPVNTPKPKDVKPVKVDPTKQPAKPATIEGTKKIEPPVPPAEADPKAMMDAWMKLAEPNEHHKHMAAFVGEWNTSIKSWMPGSETPTESKGTMVSKMAFDGRYLHSEYSGDFMGMPFKGVGVMSYNNATKKHESIWFDNMSTGLMTSQGECSADGKVFTLHGEFDDPMSGQKVQQREVSTVLGADKFQMEMFHTMNGKEMKVMEISYTRKGASDAAPAIKDAVKDLKKEAEKVIPTKR